MRFRTLEIRWHDSKPIASCDFQPAPVEEGASAAGPGAQLRRAVIPPRHRRRGQPRPGESWSCMCRPIAPAPQRCVSGGGEVWGTGSGDWCGVVGSMHADSASQIWMVHPHLRPARRRSRTRILLLYRVRRGSSTSRLSVDTPLRSTSCASRRTVRAPSSPPFMPTPVLSACIG